MLKRFALVLALATALCFVFAGAAYANMGPHGGYVDDTDACAGCHRAHTSFSTVGWTDGVGVNHPSALLVGSASTMTEFCNACHGDLAPGAATNVVSGVFDSGPTGDNTIALGGTSQANNLTDGNDVVDPTSYESSSTFNAPLNGGGFARMPDPYIWEGSAVVTAGTFAAATSAHNMEAGAQPLWGVNNALSNWPNLDCADCHDPHGTSNFRLLKAKVGINNNTVGGYLADGETPNAYVYSWETGYPTPGSDPANPGGGWLKHEAGQAQMQAYRPDYTGGTKILHTDASGAKSMSVWCAGCHEQYNNRSSAYNYGANEAGGAIGSITRHRHPVDITLAAGYGPGRALVEQVVEDTSTGQLWVPLEKDVAPDPEFYQNYIGCLTCHRAHGSSADMTGYAAAHLEQNGTGTWAPVRDGIPGVEPAKQDVVGGATGTSSLLRADNRGVCERCHNK